MARTDRPVANSEVGNTIATLYDDKYSSTQSDNLSGRVYAELGDLKIYILGRLKVFQ